MAGCYHDKQDFKSDLKIEVAREGDILEADQDLDEIECTKNPGHRGFIPFKDLTLDRLPSEVRNTEVLDGIKKMGNIVVRLVVDKVQNGRQIREAGTGFVFNTDNTYFIRTNNHVVRTEDEVKNCSVEFHYENDGTSSVLTSRGVKLEYTCPYRDITLFTIHPVPVFLHQLDGWLNDIYHIIPSIVIMDKNNQILTEEIYPYRKHKMYQLKFSSHLNLNSSIIDLMFLSLPDGSISYLKSSYFKFQPIPSNIQELTSIEIHIDEDSRVIPGDVVKFGNEYVVQISECIFQHEVKKCRLVWNGKVIGRGTRLYFQQVKTSDMFSGIDLERYMSLGRENYYIFEFQPIPRLVKAMQNPRNSSNVCCIGHPHGGIKMVTFGRGLGISLERFDNQYRRITQHGPDCKCKEVECIKYSCKTCPGSSGSPVFPLVEDMNLGYGFNHFLGEKVENIVFNGELIENKNIAWRP